MNWLEKTQKAMMDNGVCGICKHFDRKENNKIICSCKKGVVNTVQGRLESTHQCLSFTASADYISAYEELSLCLHCANNFGHKCIGILCAEEDSFVNFHNTEEETGNKFLPLTEQECDEYKSEA